jgi:hypothetical protein
MSTHKRYYLGTRLAWVIVGIGLILLSTFLTFSMNWVLETIFGAETLYYAVLTCYPGKWLWKWAITFITCLLVLLVMSRPVWNDGERKKALILFAVFLLFYLVWGFVLGALPAWERPLRIAGEAGIFFMLVVNVRQAARIRLRVIREEDDQ